MGCGRGQVYKCEWGWDHCSVLGGCLLLLSLCSSGFQDLLRLKPPSLLMLLGCISISMASLMMWSWLKLCSATPDLSGWTSLICLSCSLMWIRYNSQHIITNSTHVPQTSCKRDLISLYLHWHYIIFCHIVSLIIVSNLMMAKSEMAETCSWYVMCNCKYSCVMAAMPIHNCSFMLLLSTQNKCIARFKVLTVVLLRIQVFRDVTLCHWAAGSPRSFTILGTSKHHLYSAVIFFLIYTLLWLAGS